MFMKIPQGHLLHYIFTKKEVQPQVTATATRASNSKPCDHKSDTLPLHLLCVH